MFVRPSQRRLQSRPPRSLLAAYDQLTLPWLCPALLNSQPVSRSFSGVADRPRPASSAASKRPGLATDHAGRGFASPATPTAFEGLEDHIPFDDPELSSPWAARDGWSKMPTWDLSTIVRNPVDSDINPELRRRRIGVASEVEEAHAVMIAQLQIGQFDAAARTLSRLQSIQDLGSLAIQKAHMAYTVALASHVIVTKDEAMLNRLARWINEDVRAKGIPINETMIMLLVQASLRAVKKQKTNRMVRRFLHLAQKEGILKESLVEIESCLSDAEYRRVREAGHQYFAGIDGDQFIVSSNPDAANLKAHPQKGLGLKTLEQALSSFTTQHSKDEFPPDWDEQTVRQYRLEKDTVNSALERWRKEHDTLRQRTIYSDSLLSSGLLGGLMWQWHQDLTPLIRSISSDLVKDEKGRTYYARMSAKALLKNMDAAKLAATTILTVMHLLVQKKDLYVTQVVISIGTAVQNESMTEVIKLRNRDLGRTPPKGRRNVLQRLLWEERQKATSVENLVGVDPCVEREWDVTTKVKIGSLLLSKLLECATVEVPGTFGQATATQTKKSKSETSTIEAALRRHNVLRKGHSTGVIRPHEYMKFLLRRDPAPNVISKHLPMLTPPAPWIGYRRGGYLTQPVSVVRVSHLEVASKEYIQMAIRNGDMDQIFRALDILGRTGWRINQPVFDVMTEIWNSGEAFGKMPPSNPNLPYPQPPEDPDDARALRTYRLECRQVDDQNQGLHSNRCFVNLQLQVARSFLHDTFYLPHNLDFRGRVYPIPPYLNHIGADHSRGLLQFSKGKQLGATGLYWLRIHLANVFGYDKASFDDRHDFVVKHMDDVRDSARNPLGGARWWTQAEDRWQCLAACIDLANAAESPDPTQYVSHLPIHQDGTCNGLQHYAAIGGDALGAMQVNLEPGDRPADLYTAVANQVQDAIKRDAETGNSLAKILDGKIKRKIVKQTVMTNVYGVTLAGAKAQINRQLEDHYPDMLKGVYHGKFLAASYIATKVFDALASMFTGAHHIQYWLAECASRISTSINPEQVKYIEANVRADGSMPSVSVKMRAGKRTKISTKVVDLEGRARSSVIWTTPLRMPVVQPYRKTVSKLIKTNLMSLSVAKPSPADPVQKAKQVQAFPPNFIHSLDATHMMLTALRCDELGLSFASVHDSFWTHAADTNAMNRVIRESFIQMHSDDIIGRLAAEFEARYGGSMYLLSIPRFSSIGKKIASLPGGKLRGQLRGTMATRYAPLLQDLVLERRRLHLLRSEDPAEVAEGKAMVTPASIFEDMGGQKQSYIPKLDAAIGDVTNPMFAEREAFIKDILNSAKAGNETDEMAEEDERAEEPEYDLDSLDGDSDKAPMVQSGSDELSNPTGTLTSIHIPELDGEMDPEERERRQQARRARKNAMWRWYRKIHLWLPLEFPPVPKRGDYDVRRIDASPYFFS